MKKPVVSIIMGSRSDLATMSLAARVLKDHGIPFDMQIMSAHRTPDDVTRFAKGALARGVKVIIAGAGQAAHLAGVVASHTTLPVIGVPMESKSLKGIDSLLSTVQMPSGIPVATVAIGDAGAKNAGILALQILGLSDARVAKRLLGHKRSIANAVRKTNRSLTKKK
ncbi:MAG: 5-(carboxyamino)imidazole ribonucleotide mutase [Candidatus Omnitrophota bacterium]